MYNTGIVSSLDLRQLVLQATWDLHFLWVEVSNRNSSVLHEHKAFTLSLWCQIWYAVCFKEFIHFVYVDKFRYMTTQDTSYF
jgi:hypothetical protein